MTKPKTNLANLTTKSLKNRVLSAHKRIYALREELARRERIARYGTETPELQEFNVAVEATFWLTVHAKDEADAITVLEETGWLEWYRTQPGGAVVVDDDAIAYEEPVAVEEIEAIRADTAERLKKIEPTLKIGAAEGIVSSIH